MTAPRTVKPSVHLYEGHKYVNKDHTDIRVRFAAIRAQMQQQAQPQNISQLKRKRTP